MPARGRVAEAHILVLAALLVVLLALAAASPVSTKAGTFLRVAGAIAIAALGAASLRGPLLARPVRLPLVLAVAVLGLGLLTIVPLPVGWHGALSPALAALRETLCPVVPARVPMSACLIRSLDVVLLWSSAIAALLIAAMLPRSWARPFSLAIVGAGALGGALLLARDPGASRISNIKVAGIALASLAVLAWGHTLALLPDARWSRARWRAWLGSPTAAYAAGLVACGGTMAAATGATGSRSGLIGLVIGAAAAAALGRGLSRATGWRSRGLAAAFVGGLVLLAARPGTGSVRAAVEERWHVWSSGARLAASYPIVGSGLGTFREVYPASGGVHASTLLHLDNDYLQLLVEAGPLGLVLSGGFAASLLLAVARRARSAGTMGDRAGAAGAFGALVCAGVAMGGETGMNAPHLVVPVLAATGLALGADVHGSRRSKWAPGIAAITIGLLLAVVALRQPGHGSAALIDASRMDLGDRADALEAPLEHRDAWQGRLDEAARRAAWEPAIAWHRLAIVWAALQLQRWHGAQLAVCARTQLRVARQLAPADAELGAVAVELERAFAPFSR